MILWSAVAVRVPATTLENEVGALRDHAAGLAMAFGTHRSRYIGDALLDLPFDLTFVARVTIYRHYTLGKSLKFVLHIEMRLSEFYDPRYLASQLP